MKITVLGRVQRGTGKTFDGSYFTRLARSDYYLNGGEPPGQWFGSGCTALGLNGIVDAKSFANVLEGLGPNGSPLKLINHLKRRPKRVLLAPVRKTAKPSVPGYDLCFSAPKSVSALWASSSTQDRSAIETAFDVAVTSTLEWLIKNVPLVRRGSGGSIALCADPIVAMFDHGTARVSNSGRWEPQVHRHCVFANSALADGRFSAVNSRLLHEWARTLGPMFRASLAAELQSRLGLGLVRPTDRNGQLASWFELSGIPSSLCQYWSSRSGEIDSLVGDRSGIGKVADARAREAANLRSRNAKGDVPPRSKLLAEWQEAATEHGLTMKVIEGLKHRAVRTDPEAAFQQAWKVAREEMDACESTFTYREAVQRVCEAAQTFGVNGHWLADRTRQELEQSRDIRRLGSIRGVDRYATEEMWQLEESLLSTLKTLRNTPGVAVKDSIRSQLASKHSALLPEQQDAVDFILSMKGSLRILTGVAGAGKSTTIDVLRQAFELNGNRVIGGAIAGVAKEELADKAHIPSRTIASYLHHLDRTPIEKLVDRAKHDLKQIVRAAQGKTTHTPTTVKIDCKTVLILDEAGMIDTPTLKRLAEIVSERGATLILVGDTAQLQSIAAGGGLEHLLNHERAPHLTTNLRQGDQEDCKASECLRQGEAAVALKNYVDRGRLTIAGDRAEAIRLLVNDWMESGGAVNPHEHLIFTPTRIEAEAVNSLAQHARLSAGQINPQKSIENGQVTICQGDRVLFHRTSFADGIRNGYRGEVIDVNRFSGKLTILLDGKKGRKVTIRLRDYGPDGLSLSYGMTVHKGQGQTVANAYVLVGGQMADREMAYVQATRGAKTTKLFVDELHAGEELKDLSRALTRSRKKELAHDVAATLLTTQHAPPAQEL